ncbi:MAG TPA: archaetidylserine decarboxylase [Polyangiales bacterium]
MLISPSRVAATSLKVLPRKGLSRALGKMARIEAPASVLRVAIRAYCRAYGVDLSECEVPASGYDSFDAFFTRKLKPGARPLDVDPEALVSPADGRLEDLGPIELGSTLRVKGRSYSVGELLGDERAASLYAGGIFAVVYLSPRDYHRVHAPVDGRVRYARHVPGTLFPVNDIGVRHIPRLFARNERVVIEQESPVHGPVATVMVGAIGVGRISVSFNERLVTNDGRSCGEVVYTERDAPRLVRGDELGAFHLGSTAIIFAGPGSGLGFVKRAGESVRCGEALLRKQAVRSKSRG